MKLALSRTNYLKITYSTSLFLLIKQIKAKNSDVTPNKRHLETIISISRHPRENRQHKISSSSTFPYTSEFYCVGKTKRDRISFFLPPTSSYTIRIDITPTHPYSARSSYDTHRKRDVPMFFYCFISLYVCCFFYTQLKILSPHDGAEHKKGYIQNIWK